MAEVNVHGLRELNRLFKLAGPAAKKELTAELRSIAEPIRADAESLARSGIPTVGLAWSRFRVGVTQKLVYVAPRQRGARGRGNRRGRPRFADLLEARSTRPALERNKAQLEARVEATFERLARRFNDA
jgi:hypothetical protein